MRGRQERLALRGLQGGHAHDRRQALLGVQRRAFHCHRHERAGGAGSCSIGCGSARTVAHSSRARRALGMLVGGVIGSSLAGRTWGSSTASSVATLAEPSTSRTSSDSPAWPRRPPRRVVLSPRDRGRGESSKRHGRADSGVPGRRVEPFQPAVSGDLLGDEVSVGGSRALLVRRARRRGVNLVLIEGGGEARRGDCISAGASAGVTGPSPSRAAMTLSVSGDISEALRRPRLMSAFDDSAAKGCGSSTDRLASAIRVCARCQNQRSLNFKAPGCVSLTSCAAFCILNYALA